MTVFVPSRLEIFPSHQVLYSARVPFSRFVATSVPRSTLRRQPSLVRVAPIQASVTRSPSRPPVSTALPCLRSSKGSGLLTHRCHAVSLSSSASRVTCGGGRGSGRGFAGGHLLVLPEGASQKGHFVVKMISNNRLKLAATAI